MYAKRRVNPTGSFAKRLVEAARPLILLRDAMQGGVVCILTTTSSNMNVYYYNYYVSAEDEYNSCCKQRLSRSDEILDVFNPYMSI